VLAIATSSIFSNSHIVLTAAISGVIAATICLAWQRGERRVLDAVAIGVLTAGAVFMLRKSANMPQLNDDGLSGFSANDWLAPTVTFVALGVYGAFRRPSEPRRYQQSAAAATVVALVVNVLTI
jgi:hypothetical protein